MTNTNLDFLENLENSDILNNNTLLDNLDSEKIDNNLDDLILKQIDNEYLNNSNLDDILNDNNFLENLDNKNNNPDDILNNNNLENLYKKPSKLLNSIIFSIKYISTSALIFWVLILWANYSAYIEIARSYLNPEILENNKNALIASVNNNQITSVKDTKIEEIKEDKPSKQVDEKDTKIEESKNKTFHSINKLINKESKDFNANIEIVPYENRIIIPKIAKNIPLIDVWNKTVSDVAELENIFQSELMNWIVRYPWSARPWEKWNSFIFGHSSNFPWIKWEYNDVFALIDNLTFGDEIISYYWQKKYIYKVKEKKVIKPWDISVLKRDENKKEITLMTCWPVWTTLNRMIVVWELVEVK